MILITILVLVVGLICGIMHFAFARYWDGHHIADSFVFAIFCMALAIVFSPEMLGQGICK